MTPSEPRRVPRFLACLIKGPAGCLAFLLGATAVGVLLLPAAGGRVVGRMCEGWFEDRYAGELELGDAWLGSFYGPNQVERLILRDPVGDEVLRGSIAGPTLSGVLEGSRHRYGPLRVQLELVRLIADEDGVTNLERALELDAFPEELGRGSSLSIDTPFEIELELHVVRLRYTSERGREALLEDLRFHGRLELGPHATHLVLKGESEEEPVAGTPWQLEIEYERAEDGLARPWDVDLELEGLPAVLAHALCPAVRPLGAELGALVDDLEWTRQKSAVELDCRDGEARLAFQGMDLDGVVGGAPEKPLELELACDSPLGRALIERCLPPLERLDCDDPAAPHVVRLHAFQWPLDGDWSRLEGEAELAFAPGRATLRALAPSAAGPLVALLGPQPTRLPVREGILDFAGFQLPLENGWIRLDGALELASGARTLAVSGESAGQALERVEVGDGEEHGERESAEDREEEREVDEPPAPDLPPPPRPPSSGEPAVPEAPRPER